MRSMCEVVARCAGILGHEDILVARRSSESTGGSTIKDEGVGVPQEDNRDVHNRLECYSLRIDVLYALYCLF